MAPSVRELEAKLIQAQTAVECLAALLELAEAHAGMHRNREGLRCAREALNIARARGDFRSAARALTAAARCHYQRGDYVSAAAAGFDAVASFGDKDLAGRSSALCGVALTLLAVESFELAESLARRATNDAGQAGDAEAEACARSAWGTVLARRGRFGEARRRFREAGAIQRRLGETARLKASASCIGHTYREQGCEAMRQGDSQSARLLWRHAIRVYRVALSTGSFAAEDALARAAVAECECRLDNPARALEEIRAALELAADSASPRILALCHFWESQALKALGKVDAARRAVEVARNAAEQLERDILLVECLKAESTLNDLSGRFESAHDLESRAEREALERSAAFAGIREELNMLLARHAESAPAFLRAVA